MLQVLTEANPLTHVGEAARMFMTGGIDVGEIAIAIGFILAIAAIGLYLAGRSFAALVTAD